MDDNRSNICRWLLAYRCEFHGELLSWLEDVLEDARAAAVAAVAGLPYDLSGPDRFQSLALAPLATRTAAADTLAEVTRTFQAAIEKPLTSRTADGRSRYGLRFAPKHAERLARAFAEARLARPAAPLGPELQVVLAHLLARATDDGHIVPLGGPRGDNTSAIGAADRQIAGKDVWERHFAPWQDDRRHAAMAAAVEAFADVAQAFGERHDERLERERRELDDWLRARTDELCGVPVVAQTSLFDDDDDGDDGPKSSAAGGSGCRSLRSADC